MQIDLLRQQLPGVGIEVGIPAGWSRQGEEHAQQVRFLAEPLEGYRSSIALSAGRLDPPTPAGFEALIESVPGSLSARQPDTEVVVVRRFAHHGLPACVFRLRWTPDAPPPGADRIDTFEQLLVLIVLDPEQGRLIQIDATTIEPLAEAHLPLLHAIAETVRPLPQTDDTEGDAS